MKLFSRAEVAMVSGVLVVVGSIIGSITYSLTNNRVRSMVNSDFEAIENAMLAFNAEYNQLPTNFSDYYDFQYGLEGDLSNNDVMNALQAIDGPGNVEHALNTKEIVYIKIPRASLRQSGLDRDGIFVDPWGSEYRIMVDTDGNEVCAMEDMPYDSAVGKRVAIWSIGPDKKRFTWDDLRSWK